MSRSHQDSSAAGSAKSQLFKDPEAKPYPFELPSKYRKNQVWRTGKPIADPSEDMITAQAEKMELKLAIKSLQQFNEKHPALYRKIYLIFCTEKNRDGKLFYLSDSRIYPENLVPAFLTKEEWDKAYPHLSNRAGGRLTDGVAHLMICITLESGLVPDGYGLVASPYDNKLSIYSHGGTHVAPKNSLIQHMRELVAQSKGEPAEPKAAGKSTSPSGPK